MQGEAFAFRREAKRARRVMWWKVSQPSLQPLMVPYTCRHFAATTNSCQHNIVYTKQPLYTALKVHRTPPACLGLVFVCCVGKHSTNCMCRQAVYRGHTWQCKPCLTVPTSWLLLSLPPDQLSCCVCHAYCVVQNVRMWFIMGGIVAAVVFLIVLSACGWNFKHC